MPAHDRHENRREVADSKHQVRQSNEHRKPGRCVRDDGRIDAGQSPRRQAPESCKRVDPFIKMDQPEPARRPEADHGAEQGQGDDHQTLAGRPPNQDEAVLRSCQRVPGAAVDEAIDFVAIPRADPSAVEVGFT